MPEMSPVPTTPNPYDTSCIVFSSCQKCHPYPQRPAPMTLVVLCSRHARNVTRTHNAQPLWHYLYCVLVIPEMSPVPTTPSPYDIPLCRERTTTGDDTGEREAGGFDPDTLGSGSSKESNAKTAPSTASEWG